MPRRPARSLKHEYELYVEREIENYKESLPRHLLLSIGDEAAAVLAQEQQLVLTEVLLCEEVDRIIFRRLRLPSYTTWRRRRLKELEELRRPEYWGIAPDAPLVREVRPKTDGQVLVAGQQADSPALYLAANGCEVIAIAEERDAVQRVIDAAEAVGLTERVHAQVGGLGSWKPDAPLIAVICTPEAFAGLTSGQRGRAIEQLQRATSAGGVHLVQTDQASLTVEELQRRYRGWQISVEQEIGNGNSFLARKALS